MALSDASSTPHLMQKPGPMSMMHDTNSFGLPDGKYVPKVYLRENATLFEIDTELETTFDAASQEQTCTISDEAKQCCIDLFAELGRKVDRIARYVRATGHKESPSLQIGRKPEYSKQHDNPAFSE
jgi:hypothetical protein